MPRKRSNPAPEIPAPGPGAAEVIKRFVPADNADDPLSALRDLSEDGGSIELSRSIIQGRDAGRWAYLERIPILDFSQEIVKTRHGGGRYRAKLLNSSGRYVPNGRVEFVIDGGPQVLAAPVVNPAPVMAVAGDPVAARLDQLILLMQTQRPQSTDGLGAIKELLGLVPLIVPLFNQERGSATAMLDMFFRGREEGIKTRGGGGSAPAVDWGPMIELGKNALALMQQRAAAGQGAPPAGVADPRQIEMFKRRNQAPVTAGSGPVSTRPLWFAPIAPYIGMLVMAVRMGQSAEAVAPILADWIEKHGGTVEGGAVWELIAGTDALGLDGQLVEQVPSWQDLPIEPRRAWLAALQAEVIGQFTENDGGEHGDGDAASESGA